MSRTAMCDSSASQLAIIDVQDRLSGVMVPDALAAMTKNCGILLQAARLLDIPSLYTEQYPRGLGATLPYLTQWLAPETRVEKTSFSCCEESEFCALMDDTRPQIVLAGMEAHICILQTALQLQEMHHQVFVVEDAVISRSPANKANALDRLRQAGVIVTTTESVIFEWLKVAEGEKFKAISQLVR